jgi:hypothetical protein
MGGFALRPAGRPVIGALLAFSAALLAEGRAQARPEGIDSSRFGAEGCNECHSGGIAPEVSLTASSTSPAPGEAILLTFTVTSGSPTQTAGGFNLRSSQQGTFAPGGPDADATRAVANAVSGWLEATHTMPKPGMGTPARTTFTVTWTPSAAVAGTVTFTAWGNSVNLAAGNMGDRAASATLPVSYCTTMTYYRDGDADGFGDPARPMAACAPPVDHVANNTDCDDNAASIHPGAAETCNGADDDCNGMVDDGLPISTFYRDSDGDTFGAAASGTTMACSLARAGTGFVDNNTDCNDAAPTINPGAAEICNGADEDCDTMPDDGLPTSTFYRDNDGDAYGAAASGMTMACSLARAGTGFVDNNTDCNDAAPTINPAATEICNGADDDCDTMPDDGLPVSTFYRDLDADSHGAATSGTTMACSLARAGAGFVDNNTDCNDDAASIRPGATEICNGVDDDCDTMPDDGLPSVPFYRDNDGDGHGAPASGTRMACSQAAAGAGWVETSGDCNDADRNAFPGAQEVCDNGRDDNCNGTVDSDAPASSTFYRDADGDGFGAAASGTATACAPPAGHVSSNTDCNDADPAVRPGGEEVCNGRDDDCNSNTDEGLGTLSCGAPACPTTVTACVGGVPQTCTPVCPDAALPVDAPPDTAPPDTAPPRPDTRPSPPDTRAPDTAVRDAGVSDARTAGAPDVAPPRDTRPTDSAAARDSAATDARPTDSRRSTDAARVARVGGGGCDCAISPSSTTAALPNTLALLSLLLLRRRRQR